MNELLWHSLVALGAGVLLNFTPCVLPVVPFKVQAVLRDLGQSRGHRWGAAMAMLAGSLLFFAVLGGFTLWLGLTWGALFQSKTFIAALTLFLLASGLITLTSWTLPLPQWIYKIEGRRYSGAALTGMLTGVLATPCSGPFLGAVLAYALTRPPLIGLVIFLSIGTGLVLPYMLLLIWPWLGQKSLKAGPWADQIKQLLGFVLIGAAVFFSQSLISPDLGSLLWDILAGLLLIWAALKLWHHRRLAERIVPLLAVVVCIAMFALRTPGTDDAQLGWQPFSNTALAAARSAEKPVMIEFTAEWCLNCQVLKKTTYADAEVHKTAGRIGLVSLRVDMTAMTAEQQQLLIFYGGRAIPFVVLIDGHGGINRTFTGLFSAQTLVESLDQLFLPPAGEI